MEKRERELLARGAAAVGINLTEGQLDTFAAYAAELARWGGKINLTSLRDPAEIVERHFVDSLALARFCPSGALLDLGTGAGFPGMPLQIVRQDLHVTMVDSSLKRIAFVKMLLARFDLKATAFAARVEGDPAKERIPPATLVVSRAFKDVSDWLKLARSYTLPGGAVAAMLGKTVAAETNLSEMAISFGMTLESEHRFSLPFSGAERGVAIFRMPHE